MLCILTDAFGGNRRVELEPLTGDDELFVRASEGPSPRCISELLARTVRWSGGDRIGRDGARALTIAERDLLVAYLRRLTFGDHVRATVRCPSSACRAPLDVDFTVTAFLDSRRPSRPRRVARGEAGWYVLGDAGPRFRPPTGADEEELGENGSGELSDRGREIAARCVTPMPGSAQDRMRVERALWHVAPQLAGEALARCVSCDTAFPVFFDIRAFFVREVQLAARWLEREVHLLASAYGWGEREILALPRDQRVRYADLVASDRLAGRVP